MALASVSAESLAAAVGSEYRPLSSGSRCLTLEEEVPYGSVASLTLSAISCDDLAADDTQPDVPLFRYDSGVLHTVDELCLTVAEDVSTACSPVTLAPCAARTVLGSNNSGGAVSLTAAGVSQQGQHAARWGIRAAGSEYDADQFVLLSTTSSSAEDTSGEPLCLAYDHDGQAGLVLAPCSGHTPVVLSGEDGAKDLGPAGPGSLAEGAGLSYPTTRLASTSCNGARPVGFADTSASSIAAVWDLYPPADLDSIPVEQPGALGDDDSVDGGERFVGDAEPQQAGEGEAYPPQSVTSIPVETVLYERSQ